MTEIIQWIIVSLLVNVALDITLTPVLMVLYAALAHVQKVAKEYGDTPPTFMKVLFAGALWLALKVDVYINYSLGTKLFLCLPRWGDWTLSQRMSYYWDTDTEAHWRRRLVGWIERNTWLNRLDWRKQHIGSKP